jgi:hypothetical protein
MTGRPLSLLFTGHMIDLPGRAKPRFPAELEPQARRAIAQRVEIAMECRPKDLITGFASLARGGDILFHEACRARGARTIVVLPFAPARFLKTSVKGAPSGNWQERFNSLWNATAPSDRHELGLPETDEAYAACNQRLLQLARAQGEIHLIALWDGGRSGGPGGTADFVRQVRSAGDKPDIIDPASLRSLH